MAFSRAFTLLGASGAGQLAKMVNQICIAGLVQGLSEAIAFGQKAGLDMNQVLDVIGKGAAQSWQMDNRGKTMVADKFDFGFAVDWMRKDLGLVLDEAKRNGARLPVTALVDQFYADVQQMGGGRWDTSMSLHADHHHLACVCRFDGRQHVGRVATRGNGQQHVAGLTQGAHLTRENFVEAVIVADGGEDGAVGRQRDGTELGAFTLETPDELGGKMLSVGGRTAIAACQHLAAVGHAGQHGLHGRRNGLAQDLRGLVLQVGAVDKVLFDALFQHGQHDNRALRAPAGLGT
jgi:hypothetical protein